MYNLRSVLGESVWDWWKPQIAKHILEGDGTRFKIKVYKNVPTAESIGSSSFHPSLCLPVLTFYILNTEGEPPKVVLPADGSQQHAHKRPAAQDGSRK